MIKRKPAICRKNADGPRSERLTFFMQAYIITIDCRRLRGTAKRPRAARFDRIVNALYNGATGLAKRKGWVKMAKVYIRAGMSPLEPISVSEAIQKNAFLLNSGNLVFQYSVFRTLMRDDTQFIVRTTEQVLQTPGELERIQQECDFAIFPLANAFRKDYNLKQDTEFIRRVKIPCVVIGCGLQARKPEDIAKGFSFDEDVRAFVSAVLDKSAMLGLRGEYTAEYFKRLGFAPERHFTVIGCPSFFLHGPEMPAPRLTQINRETRFSFNTRALQPEAMDRVLARAEAQYPNYHLVLQLRRELAMLAFGTLRAHMKPNSDKSGHYPYTRFHRDVRNKKAIAFTSARAWFDYMHTIDYSFGSRFHGNAAAFINGTPAFVVTSDTRTEELCRYGQVAHMRMSDLTPDSDVRDLLEKADFSGVCRGHAQRFSHYLDFLNQNGVPHIYSETLHPKTVPFDEAIRRQREYGRVYRGCLPAGTALLNGIRLYADALRKHLHKTVAI